MLWVPPHREKLAPIAKILQKCHHVRDIITVSSKLTENQGILPPLLGHWRLGAHSSGAHRIGGILRGTSTSAANMEQQLFLKKLQAQDTSSILSIEYNGPLRQ